MVNQAISFVMLQASVLTVAIFYGKWREAAVVAAVTFALAWWLFRDRPAAKPTQPITAKP